MKLCCTGCADSLLPSGWSFGWKQWLISCRGKHVSYMWTGVTAEDGSEVNRSPRDVCPSDGGLKRTARNETCCCPHPTRGFWVSNQPVLQPHLWPPPDQRPSEVTPQWDHLPQVSEHSVVCETASSTRNGQICGAPMWLTENQRAHTSSDGWSIGWDADTHTQLTN